MKIHAPALKMGLLVSTLVGNSVTSRHPKIEIESDVLEEDALFFGRELQAMSIPPDVCIDFQLSFEFTPRLENGNIVPGERIRPGEYLSHEYFDAFGLELSSTGGDLPYPQVFDSSNPNPLDLDLGTPHRDFGGPGRSAGGRRGAPGENSVDLGNILIVQENDPNGNGGDQSNPNDKLGGGTITFDWVDPVQFVEEVGMIDIGDDQGRTNIEVTYFMPSEFGGVVERFRRIPVDGTGNNGVVVVPIGLPNVKRFTVNFGTSGGITFVNYCQDVVRVGFGAPSVNVGGFDVALGSGPTTRGAEDTVASGGAEDTSKGSKRRMLEDSTKSVDSTKISKGRKLSSTNGREQKPSRTYTRGAKNKHTT